MKIILIAAVVVLLSIAFGLLFLLYMSKKKDSSYKNLMGTSGFGSIKEMRERFENDEDGSEFERFKEMHRKQRQKSSKSDEPTIDELLFQAGYFTKKQKKDFERIQYLYPIVLSIIVMILFYFFFTDILMTLLGLVAGAMAGLVMPKRSLESKIKKRSEEIMFFLPLVIEQISIGVSSSLDIGPCVQQVVDMADERNKQNVVTEFLRFVQQQVRSGISLPEALSDVGVRSGHAELKQTFLALAQVVRHGGEISKQLMELANAVSKQREAMIQDKIKKLELKATLPVALVFFGFMVILLTGFGLQIVKGLG